MADILTSAVIASFAIAFGYVILLLLSKAFGFRELEISAKRDALDAFGILLLVSLFIPVMSFSSHLVSKFVAGSVECGMQTYEISESSLPTSLYPAFDFAECKFLSLGENLAEIQHSIKKEAEKLFTKFSLFNTYAYVFGAPIFQGRWSSSLFKFVERYRMLNTFTASVLVKINEVLLVLKYVKNNALSVFLPIGLFLRSLNPFKSVGALFISLSLSFYFVFPAVFVLTDVSYKKTDASSLVSNTSPNACFSVADPSAAFDSTYLEPSSSQNLASLSYAIASVQKVSVYIYVYPFVAFAISLMFARYLMYVLGGEAHFLMRFVSRVI